MELIISVEDDFDKDIIDVLRDVVSDCLDPTLGFRYVAQFASLETN